MLPFFLLYFHFMCCMPYYVQWFTIGNDFMKLSGVFYTLLCFALLCWVLKMTNTQHNRQTEKNRNLNQIKMAMQEMKLWCDSVRALLSIKMPIKNGTEAGGTSSNMLDLWILNLTKATTSRTHGAAKRLFVVNLSLFDAMILILDRCVHIKDGDMPRTPIVHLRKRQHRWHRMTDMQSIIPSSYLHTSQSAHRCAFCHSWHMK